MQTIFHHSQCWMLFIEKRTMGNENWKKSITVNSKFFKRKNLISQKKSEREVLRIAVFFVGNCLMKNLAFDFLEQSKLSRKREIRKEALIKCRKSGYFPKKYIYNIHLRQRKIFLESQYLPNSWKTWAKSFNNSAFKKRARTSNQHNIPGIKWRNAKGWINVYKQIKERPICIRTATMGTNTAAHNGVKEAMSLSKIKIEREDLSKLHKHTEILCQQIPFFSTSLTTISKSALIAFALGHEFLKWFTRSFQAHKCQYLNMRNGFFFPSPLPLPCGSNNFPSLTLWHWM